ncbi:hypothetical protein TSOC_014618, partial [Tetrabaena socialis]
GDRSGSKPGGAGGGGSGGRQVQSGLSQFYRQTARCLACKRALPQQAEATLAPGLCEPCLSEPDTWLSTYLAQLADDGTATLQLCSAHSTCMACHSGGHYGAVLCENGECGTLFARLGSARRVAAATERVARMAAACGPGAAAEQHLLRW